MHQARHISLQRPIGALRNQIFRILASVILHADINQEIYVAYCNNLILQTSLIQNMKQADSHLLSRYHIKCGLTHIKSPSVFDNQGSNENLDLSNHDINACRSISGTFPLFKGPAAFISVVMFQKIQIGHKKLNTHQICCPITFEIHATSG